MKLKILLNSVLSFSLLCLLLCANICKAQLVEISSNGGLSTTIAMGSSNYHVSEAIYLDSEIGSNNFVAANKELNHLAINVNTSGLPLLFSNVAIYMKNVPAATTSFASGDYNKTGYTKVYDGTLYLGSAGWTGVDLTPFVRTAGSNLSVMFERLDGVARTASFTYLASSGNSTSSGVASTRRYNGVAAPVINGTTLQAGTFRPAVQFSHINTVDASIATIDLPTSSCFSTAQTVNVVLYNSGSNTPITPGTATVKITVSGANNFTQTVTNTTWIDPGNIEVFSFNNVNLSNVGYNAAQATVSFAGDQDSQNDTLTYGNTTTSVTTAFPVIENSENTPLDHIRHFKVLGGSAAWARQTGKIKNPNLTDSLAPHSGNKFYIFDAYSVAEADVVLHSECLTLPPAGGNNGSYYVSFWMSHDTSFTTPPYRQLDSLYLVISNNQGVTWTRLAGYQRNDPQFAIPGWQNHQVDIPAYAGQTVQIGFEGVSDFGNIIGLDDITIMAPSLLPVKFISFAGERSGTTNHLTWSTATEANNKGFELQRSIDGSSFSTLSFVRTKSAEGNSASLLNYDFIDRTPFATANYYRLKQTDKDGKNTYSNVVLISGTKATNLSITALYPNPAVNNVTLAIASPARASASIVVTDLAGRIVMQQATLLLAGDNVLQLNVKSMAKGTYTLKLISVDGTSSNVVRQLIKQ